MIVAKSFSDGMSKFSQHKSKGVEGQGGGLFALTSLPVSSRT